MNRSRTMLTLTALLTWTIPPLAFLGSPAQAAPAPLNGTGRLVSGQSSFTTEFCADVNRNSDVNGTKIQTWECNATIAQQWTGVATDSSIRAKGKCLDLVNGGTQRLTNVQLWECNGSAAQKWNYNPTNKNLVNPGTNLCLTAPNRPGDGSQLIIDTCSSAGNQQWELIDRIASGQTTFTTDYCVDVNRNSDVNGTKIQTWECNATPAQQWTGLNTDSSLRAKGKCMDLVNGGTTRLTSVQLWECNGSAAQRWNYNLTTKALVNPGTNLCLTAPNLPGDGSQLIVDTCTGAGNQQWMFTY